LEEHVKALKAAVLSAVFILASVSAEAYPILQLDIIGGQYDAATQTIVSSDSVFTLVAVLTPTANEPLTPYLSDTYYISAAVSPEHGPDDASLGSFTWNDTNYRVTEDMTYGVPPLDDGNGAGDSGDLAPHSIFPTFFSEFSFQFSPENRTLQYNTADNPGGLTPTTATTNVSYFATFNITTSLVGSNVLHFDLYNSLVQSCRRSGTCTYDADIELFAPFSHDAESSVTHHVAEPQSMLIMSVGLLVAARALRRDKRS
jgi:hypothetical protein